MIKLHLPKQTPYIVTYEKYTNFEKHNFFWNPLTLQKSLLELTLEALISMFMKNAYDWKKNLWANHFKLVTKELSKAMLT